MKTKNYKCNLCKDKGYLRFAPPHDGGETPCGFCNANGVSKDIFMLENLIRKQPGILDLDRQNQYFIEFHFKTPDRDQPIIYTFAYIAQKVSLKTKNSVELHKISVYENGASNMKYRLLINDSDIKLFYKLLKTHLDQYPL